jgi:hypothetical protein
MIQGSSRKRRVLEGPVAHGGRQPRSWAACVFVDEMGTRTSLAPLYAYTPIGERAFFVRSRETVARTPPCLRRAFIKKGWDLLWSWKGRPPPESSKLM